jgi:tryptophan-rich sensory protein
LYFMMGVSLYIVGQKKGKNDLHKKGQTYFFIQLLLNAVWSIVFFGLQSPLLALFIILALWISILMSIKYFYTISKTAGLLLVPYLAWVSFASLLNFFIMILNL